MHRVVGGFWLLFKGLWKFLKVFTGVKELHQPFPRPLKATEGNVKELLLHHNDYPRTLSTTSRNTHMFKTKHVQAFPHNYNAILCPTLALIQLLAPRCLNMGHGWPMMTPRWTQGGPKGSRDSHKIAQNGPSQAKTIPQMQQHKLQDEPRRPELVP